MDQFPPTTESRVGGRVVFLIDESEALGECIAGGTKAKAESIATALNSLLNQLAAVADLEVAVAGYRGDPNGGADVGCRAGGALAGRRFVPAATLAEAPLLVEDRVRRLGATPAGAPAETVRFPIWYVPQIGKGIFPELGYAYCRHLVVAGTTPQTVWSKPPMVVSFVGDLLQQAETAVERVLGLSSPGGPPLVLHVHLGGAGSGPAVLYPSSDVHLPPGLPLGRFFRLSSVLPDYLIAVLREAQAAVGMGARGMIYNATVTDLIRMLSLVKTYAQQEVFEVPPAGEQG